MRLLALLLPLLPSAPPGEEVKMKMIINGDKVGLATYRHAVAPDGSLSAAIDLRFTVRGLTSVGHMIYEVAKSGRPLRYEVLFDFDGSIRGEAVVYGDQSVSVTEEIDGRKSIRAVPIPRGKTLTSQRAFWFIRSRPIAGAVDKFWTYDSDKKKWTPETCRYIGLKTIKVGSATVTAHEIRETDGTFWLDNKGVPYRIAFDEGELSFVLERMK